MKNALIILMVLIATGLIAFGLNKNPAPLLHGQTSAVISSIANTFKGSVPAMTDQGQETVKRLSKLIVEIATLSNQLQDVDHELDAMGFPKVFLDNRLSSEERANLLAKVKLSSGLQTRIARLKVQKIDLDARENL